MTEYKKTDKKSNGTLNPRAKGYEYAYQSCKDSNCIYLSSELHTYFVEIHTIIIRHNRRNKKRTEFLQ